MKEKRMITLKYSELLGFNFSQAMQNLTSMKLPSNVSYQIMKIADAMNKEHAKAHAAWQGIVNQYAKKDENGKIIPRSESQPDSFTVDEKDQAAFDEAHKVFGATTFTIDRNPLALSDLGHNPMSAAELSVLSAIITEKHPEEAHAPNVVSFPS